MDCKKSSDLMTLALDQGLNKEETKEFHAHLENCDTCREDYELYQSIKADLNEIGTEVDLPDGFHKTLMHRIHHESATDPVDVPAKVTPLWRRMNRRTMNVAAMFALVVVFALIGVRGLNNLGVSDEAAVMNEMPEMDMAKEDAGYGATAENAAPKMMEAEMATDEVVTSMDDATADQPQLKRESVEGDPEAAFVEEETLTMMMAEESEAIQDGEVATEEASLAMTGAADEAQPHLARTEETEVTSYKASDHENPIVGETKAYTGQGTSEGYEALVVMIFGGFIAVTGLAALWILKRAK